MSNYYVVHFQYLSILFVKYAFIKLMMGVGWLETGKTAVDQTSGMLQKIIYFSTLLFYLECPSWAFLAEKVMTVFKRLVQIPCLSRKIFLPVGRHFFAPVNFFSVSLFLLANRSTHARLPGLFSVMPLIPVYLLAKSPSTLKYVLFIW